MVDCPGVASDLGLDGWNWSCIFAGTSGWVICVSLGARKCVYFEVAVVVGCYYILLRVETGLRVLGRWRMLERRGWAGDPGL